MAEDNQRAVLQALEPHGDLDGDVLHAAIGQEDEDDEQSNDSSSTPSDLPSLRLLPLNADSDDDSEWDEIPDLVEIEHNLDDIPFAALLLDTDPNNPRRNGHPDLAFFRDFCASLRQNDCTEMYRYYISRQERLVTLMLRDQGKAEEFCEASQNNTSLEHLHLDISHRYTDEQTAVDDWMGDEEYYRRWNVIGQGIGNLMGLKTLQVHAGGYLHNQNAPDFRALARLAQGARQIEKLVLTFELVQGDDVRFAEAFRNHPTMEKIEFRGYIEREPMETVSRALLTVPNLSRIDMMNCFSRRIPCRILPDSFFALVGTPSMREVALQRCCLSEEQCETLASVLSDNASIEYLDFQYSRFQDRGSAMVAAALGTNTSVQKLVYSNNVLDRESCVSLAETLLVNTTISRLQIETEEVEWAPEPQQDFETVWLDPIFVALQSNSIVSFFSIGQLCKWNDVTADKFRGALESPISGMTDLWIHSKGDARHAWERIMPALQLNQTLKNLRLLAAVGHAGVVATASTVATNTTLKTLEAYPCSRFICGVADRHVEDIHRKEKITEEDCISARAVEALGLNTTLKKLMVDTCITHHTKDASDMGCQHLVAALHKNFGLQDTDMSWGRGREYKNSMEMMSRLNLAGRRYLLEDPSDRVRGVRLLIETRDSVDCLFTHLVENPSLCEVCQDS